MSPRPSRPASQPPSLGEATNMNFWYIYVSFVGFSYSCFGLVVFVFVLGITHIISIIGL